MEISMDDLTKLKLEAAAFRGLVAHLQRRTDVQNIDLMNLSGFCRNCLSKWYMSAATDEGIDLDYEQACEIIYGMSYKEWKSKYQTEATQAQLDKFEQSKPLHALISGHANK